MLGQVFLPFSDLSNWWAIKTDARMGIYHNLESSNTTDTTTAVNQIQSYISSIRANKSILGSPEFQDLIIREVGTQIYTFMMRPVEDMEPSQLLTFLGVDSIVTIEIRNWLNRSLDGLEASTMEILNAGTIQGLGILVLEKLKAKFGIVRDV